MECPEFALNRTAAHHAIAHAVVGALRDLNLKDWVFKYETPFSDLPFSFDWTSDEEGLEEMDRRPDCTAYSRAAKRIVLMEFTRAMDRPLTMANALSTKSTQYKKATIALRKGQPRFAVHTAPFIFGALGSVAYAEAAAQLKAFSLTPAQTEHVLAAGCRAAITAASDMATARYASMGERQAALRHRKGRKSARKRLNFDV